MRALRCYWPGPVGSLGHLLGLLGHDPSPHEPPPLVAAWLPSIADAEMRLRSPAARRILAQCVPPAMSPPSSGLLRLVAPTCQSPERTRSPWGWHRGSRASARRRCSGICRLEAALSVSAGARFMAFVPRPPLPSPADGLTPPRRAAVLLTAPARADRCSSTPQSATSQVLPLLIIPRIAGVSCPHRMWRGAVPALHRLTVRGSVPRSPFTRSRDRLAADRALGLPRLRLRGGLAFAAGFRLRAGFALCCRPPWSVVAHFSPHSRSLRYLAALAASRRAARCVNPSIVARTTCIGWWISALCGDVVTPSPRHRAMRAALIRSPRYAVFNHHPRGPCWPRTS